jgi:hypothetical protein
MIGITVTVSELMMSRSPIGFPINFLLLKPLKPQISCSTVTTNKNDKTTGKNPFYHNIAVHHVVRFKLGDIKHNLIDVPLSGYRTVSTIRTK